MALWSKTFNMDCSCASDAIGNARINRDRSWRCNVTGGLGKALDRELWDGWFAGAGSFAGSSCTSGTTASFSSGTAATGSSGAGAGGGGS